MATKALHKLDMLCLESSKVVVDSSPSTSSSGTVKLSESLLESEFWKPSMPIRKDQCPMASFIESSPSYSRLMKPSPHDDMKSAEVMLAMECCD